MPADDVRMPKLQYLGQKQIQEASQFYGKPEVHQHN